MKRILMALFPLYAASAPGICQSKTRMAGLEMTDLMGRHATVQISYKFSSHWSLSGEASISFADIANPILKIEEEHKMEFATSTKVDSNPSINCERVFFSYWPSEAYRGVNISLGIQTINLKGIRCITRFGYMFHIWNNIYINSSILIPLNPTMENNIISNENLQVSISYRF